jgi:hypothetical protein
MNTFVLITIVGLLFWRLRNLYYNSLELEYEYKLFELRDKLRRAVIEEKLNANSLFFQYMDESLCRTITELSRLNLLTVLILSYRHRNKYASEEFQSSITEEINNNVIVKELYFEFGDLLLSYFHKRHRFLKGFIRVLSKIINLVNGSVELGKVLKNKVLSIRAYPEFTNINFLGPMKH